MLLENISIGRTIEIYIDREGYRYRMTSTVEETNSKRLCVTLIAANGRAFAFRPEDKVKIVYKDSEQMWEWDNVKAGIGKLGETAVHYFDITNLGTSFNRRGAYRVSLGADAMIGYYDQMDSGIKTSDIPEINESDGTKVSSSELQPKFVKGMIKDVSESGAGIFTDFNFQVDDGIFFNIPSPYGFLGVKAQIVRASDVTASGNRYRKYYGCVFTKAENKLIKYIYDIQRGTLKKQREQKEKERERIEAMKQRAESVKNADNNVPVESAVKVKQLSKGIKTVGINTQLSKKTSNNILTEGKEVKVDNGVKTLGLKSLVKRKNKPKLGNDL